VDSAAFADKDFKLMTAEFDTIDSDENAEEEPAPADDGQDETDTLSGETDDGTPKDE
jgi:hypothetical protein